MNYSHIKTLFRFVFIVVAVCIILNALDNPILSHVRPFMRDKMDTLIEVVLGSTMSPYSFMCYKQKKEIHNLQKKCSKKCNKNLRLINLRQVDELLLELDSHKLMFFLETSGSNSLTVRQACALESAVRTSGRRVFLLMTSNTVNVCENQMFPLLSLSNLLVVHLSPGLLVAHTPLQRMFADGRVNGTCCKTIHLSDIFRLAVLFRYGGWYSDMDTITVANSDQLENVVASSGDFVANGNLLFSPGNGFLEHLIVRAEERFTGQGWNSLGPVLLTEAIMDFCKVGRKTGQPIIGHHTDCWNLTVFNHPTFYPLKANQRLDLFKSQEDLYWSALFENSYSVHFFGQLTSSRAWKTGNHTAYDYLGQRFCPATYQVQGNLDLR